jgi:hypothetical protein
MNGWAIFTAPFGVLNGVGWRVFSWAYYRSFGGKWGGLDADFQEAIFFADMPLVLFGGIEQRRPGFALGAQQGGQPFLRRRENPARRRQINFD